MATSLSAPASFADDIRATVSRNQLLICVAALLVVIAAWFVAIRAPLWLDETGSYWQASGTARDVWNRGSATLDPPAYPYLLWFWMKLFGASEVVLRIPSVLAMGGGLILFYRAARIFLSRQTSMLAVLLLAAHPVVAFAAIDVRPYAFAALGTFATLYLLFRGHNRPSVWNAIGLGCAAASMVAFHYLFAAILPAVLLCIILLHVGSKPALLRQLIIASGTFVLAAAALAQGILRIFQTRNSHVFEGKPPLWLLLFAVVSFRTLIAFVVVVGAALLATNHASTDPPDAAERKWIYASLLLGLLPILLLFAISSLTSVHMFTPRHYLVGLPGCALCSALLIQHLFAPVRRVLFCVALASSLLLVPASAHHGYTWKYAIDAANARSGSDDIPIVVCSDFPEADSVPMPVPSPQKNKLYAPLSYYPVRATVIPMPRTLNAEAVKMGNLILRDNSTHHQRFLLMGSVRSNIPDWLMKNAAPNFSVRHVGDFDRVRVLEFIPR